LGKKRKGRRETSLGRLKIGGEKEFLRKRTYLEPKELGPMKFGKLPLEES